MENNLKDQHYKNMGITLRLRGCACQRGAAVRSPAHLSLCHAALRVRFHVSPFSRFAVRSFPLEWQCACPPNGSSHESYRVSAQIR